MKKVLDSVHGYILIPDRYFKYIIDTEYFQRLRRIEQTSTRSIFPSARHDRFIHSLGVYHIGNMIANQLRKSLKECKLDKTEIDSICTSYEIACLLHDCGHAPFSHTFEDYYGSKKDLSIDLKELAKDSNFTNDLTNKIQMEIASHEYVSAILTIKRFTEAIHELGGRVDFIVRMILGCYYTAPNKEIENCFISLLHGKVIDADRLDYACRDVWASGYCTSTIDLQRLISAMSIRKNQEYKYVVCFNNNCMNEIESVLYVRFFQSKYVLTHHTVSYEQWLLVKSVEQMALHYFPNNQIERLDDRANKAVMDLCNIRSLWEPVRVGEYKLIYPADGDFIHLMKQHINNDDNIREWYSRKYRRYALWKSTTEFYHYFPELKNVDLKNHAIQQQAHNLLISFLSCNIDDIVICPTRFKGRAKMDELNLVIRNQVYGYTELYGKDEGEKYNEKEFFYIYVSKKYNNESMRNKIIEKLRDLII